MAGATLPSTLRVETAAGSIYVRTDDFYVRTALVRSGAYSPSEVALLSSLLRPGDVAADIGAHIGMITLPLARRVGESGAVHAFEPQRTLFQLLCTNLVTNDIENVHAHWAAVGARAAVITLGSSPIESRNLGERGVLLARTKGAETVDLVALDDFRFTRMDLIKIDVEGFEFEVLDGAPATLGLQPMIYVENQFYLGLEQKANSAKLLARLMGLGYQLWWHCPDFVERSADPAHDVLSDGGSVNVLAISPNHARRLGPGAEAAYGLIPITCIDAVVAPPWLSLRAIMAVAIGDRKWSDAELILDPTTNRQLTAPLVEAIQAAATAAIRRVARSAPGADTPTAREIAAFVFDSIAECESEALRVTAHGPIPPLLAAFLADRFEFVRDDHWEGKRASLVVSVAGDGIVQNQIAFEVDPGGGCGEFSLRRL